ncbi:MAG: AAA family ATPase [Candidatus Nezhaarchaeales archaeon]
MDWSFLEDDRLRAIVKRALEHVKKQQKEGRQWWNWFEAYDVKADWWLLRKLVYDYNVFKIVYKSANHTTYAFEVPIEEVEKRIQEYEESLRQTAKPLPTDGKITIPPDFWSTVEGYDDLKELFMASIRSTKPVHILLIGPPGTAKSLMLMEVERLPGTVFVTAGTSTKAGIRDVLLNYRPRFLIIDELDKLTNSDDISVLLTLMESQRVIITKHREYKEEQVKTWVFASANTTRGLPPELLDRFWKVYLKPYDRETLIRVVKSCLKKLEGIHDELAGYIAQRVADMGLSVRDGVRVARVAKTKEEVDKFLNVMVKYMR